MELDKNIFDFIPVLCTKSAQGFEGGRIYAAYPHAINLFVVIKSGVLYESGVRELPEGAPGHVMCEAVGGKQLRVPWEEDSPEEWPIFVVDAFDMCGSAKRRKGKDGE